MTYTDRQIQILDYVAGLNKFLWDSAPDVKLSDSDEFKSLNKIREELKPTKDEINTATAVLMCFRTIQKTFDAC